MEKTYNRTSTDLVDIGIEFKWNNYLTTGELRYIAIEMLKCEDYLSREITKGALIVGLQTNINVEEMDYNQIYDMYCQNGLIPQLLEDIINVDLIDKSVKFEDTIANKVGMFLDNLSKKIDEFTSLIPENFNIQEFTDKFIGQIKEVTENATNKQQQ